MIQKISTAAIWIAERNAWAQRSNRMAMRRQSLSLCKHVFDFVPLFIQGFTVCCGVLALGSGGNAGGDTSREQCRTIGVAIVAFIAQYFPGGRQIRQQAAMLLRPCGLIAAPQSAKAVSDGPDHRKRHAVSSSARLWCARERGEHPPFNRLHAVRCALR